MAGKGSAALLLAALLALAGQIALAERVTVYAAQDAFEIGQAKLIVHLLGEAFPQAEWTLAEGEESLYGRVMADCAPDLAICTPGEAMPWAQEGLLLPLDGHIAGAGRIAQAVLSAGVWEERLYMAPLVAKHRQMAVNADRLERLQMRHLLDQAAYPVFTPQQLEQVLEECMLSGETGMEIWPPAEGESAAAAALAQAVYGGAWMTEDGEACPSDPAAVYGAAWLAGLVKSGAAGYAESRAAALERFLNGETAIFIDWTNQEEKLWQRRQDGAAFTLAVTPYPSAEGEIVRSFELAGVCAFSTSAPGKDALLQQAVAFLHEDERAQQLLSSRGIWQDDTRWLPLLNADSAGATLGALMEEALRDVIEGKEKAAAALLGVQAAMRAAGY